MKIKNLPVQEKKVRLDFTITESEAARLDAYRKFVAEASSRDIPLRELIAVIVVQFMDEDKEFARQARPAVTSLTDSPSSVSNMDLAGRPYDVSLTK